MKWNHQACARRRASVPVDKDPGAELGRVWQGGGGREGWITSRPGRAAPGRKGQVVPSDLGGSIDGVQPIECHVTEAMVLAAVRSSQVRDMGSVEGMIVPNAAPCVCSVQPVLAE